MMGRVEASDGGVGAKLRIGYRRECYQNSQQPRNYAYVAKFAKTGFGGESQRLSEQLMDQRAERVFHSFSCVGVLGAIHVGLVVVAQAQVVGVQEEADPQEVDRRQRREELER